MSDDEDIDGLRLPLEVALQRVVGSASGGLVACIAGRLGRDESEDFRRRYILRR